MNWDHLQVFLAVARHGQMLAAARVLGLNHTTVARRIDALEATLGAPLFHRRPNGSTLTDTGKDLVSTAERVEAEILSASARLRATEAEPGGTVRIGVPDGLGNLFLARELGLLAMRYANLVIELVPLPRSFSLSRREADLAIGLDKPTHGRLILAKLTDYTLSLYAERGYLQRAGQPDREEELAGHAGVIGVDDYAYASALNYMTFLQERTRGVFKCVGAIGQLEAVRAGAGIGVLHDFAAAGCPDLVRVLPAITFRRTYWLMSHPDSHETRRVATCRAFIMQRIREERSRFLPRNVSAQKASSVSVDT